MLGEGGGSTLFLCFALVTPTLQNHFLAVQGCLGIHLARSLCWIPGTGSLLCIEARGILLGVWGQGDNNRVGLFCQNVVPVLLRLQVQEPSCGPWVLDMPVAEAGPELLLLRVMAGWCDQRVPERKWIRELLHIAEYGSLLECGHSFLRKPEGFHLGLVPQFQQIFQLLVEERVCSRATI